MVVRFTSLLIFAIALFFSGVSPVVCVEERPIPSEDEAEVVTEIITTETPFIKKPQVFVPIIIVCLVIVVVIVVVVVLVLRKMKKNKQKKEMEEAEAAEQQQTETECEQEEGGEGEEHNASEFQTEA